MTPKNFLISFVLFVWVLSAELKKQSYGGDKCSVGEGLAEVKRLFDFQGRPGVPRLLVTISAGKSDDDVIPSAKALRDAGVLIYSVGLGPNSDHNTLRALSSSPVSEFVMQEMSFPLNTTAPRNMVEKILNGNDIKLSYITSEIIIKQFGLQVQQEFFIAL